MRVAAYQAPLLLGGSLDALEPSISRGPGTTK
jgi:hypothetical protein